MICVLRMGVRNRMFTTIVVRSILHTGLWKQDAYDHGKLILLFAKGGCVRIWILPYHMDSLDFIPLYRVYIHTRVTGHRYLLSALRAHAHQGFLRDITRDLHFSL